MRNKGFTLIEVITAAFIVTIGVLGVYSMTQRIIRSTSYSANQLTATYLAQEGIEIVRNMRDTQIINSGSWTVPNGNYRADYNDQNLSAFGGNPLLKSSGDFYNYDSGIPTIYSRRINIANTPSFIQVTVYVNWTERGETHQVEVQENLYDWTLGG